MRLIFINTEVEQFWLCRRLTRLQHGTFELTLVIPCRSRANSFQETTWRSRKACLATSISRATYFKERSLHGGSLRSRVRSLLVFPPRSLDKPNSKVSNWRSCKVYLRSLFVFSHQAIIHMDATLWYILVFLYHQQFLEYLSLQPDFSSSIIPTSRQV